MKEKAKKTLLPAAAGICIGFINALLGAGGGIIAVPVLHRMGLERKQAHANAVAVMLPVSIMSAVLYLMNGYVTVSDALPYIPGGIVGAVAGTYIMKIISPLWLKRIFGGFMIYAGIRLLLK